VLVPAAERIAAMIAPDGGDNVKGFTKKIDEFLGIDLRKDLLGSLDNQFVQYTSPSEGPINLGQTYLFKVKDQKKLEEALEQAIKGLSKLTTTEVKNKKRIYKGVEVHEVHFGQQSIPVVPTYAIHDGWLVIGYYPPAVHGYIARAKKEMGAWKPNPKTEETLKLLPQDFISVSYSTRGRRSGRCCRLRRSSGRRSTVSARSSTSTSATCPMRRRRRGTFSPTSR
jgi:hypothetical protein